MKTCKKCDITKSLENYGNNKNQQDGKSIYCKDCEKLRAKEYRNKNKDKAMKILKARLYEMQMEEAKEKEMAERKEQVGSGDRSGRIRTYNFPQNRISDHRINLTLYRLDEIMQGGVMDDIIEPLIADAQAKIMEQNGL